MNEFSRRIESLGMTRAYLSRKTGIGKAHICLLEQGEREPSFSVVDILSRELNSPVELLFPKYIRKSPLPGWKDLIRLKINGYDISAYQEWLRKIELHVVRENKI